MLVGGGPRSFGVWVVGRQAVSCVMGFGTSSKETVAEVADFGLELGNLLLERVFALSGALVQGLVVVSLLSEGDGFEAVGAGRGRSVASKQGGGEFGDQRRRARQWPWDRGEIRAEASSAHPSSMTGAQLQSQVSSKGSPIVYHAVAVYRYRSALSACA